MNKYDQDTKKIPRMQHIWTPVGDIGDKEAAWVHKEEFLSDLYNRVFQLEEQRRQEKQLLNSLLIQRGLPVTEDSNPFYIIQQMLLNSYLINKDKPTYAIEIVDGYIKKGIKIDDVIDEETLQLYQDLFNGCYKIVDGNIVLDEEKYNSMMGAVL